MFGYLTAAVSILSEEEQERYKACYCGLCRSLRGRHGGAAGLTLTYDMTFLVLLINSLYEPEETDGAGHCGVHPFKKRSYWMSEATDYAADMNLALAYHKCMDDWKDDRKPMALAEAKLISSEYEKVLGAYPRQCGAMEKSLSALAEIEEAGDENPDAAADTFGNLMAEALVYKEDRWSPTLRSMGFYLGRFIYIMDACMDLREDVVKGSYNPFKKYYGLSDNEQRFRDILKMTLGDCLMYFDRLPLVQDLGIMQNILCAGLWAQFNGKYSEDKKVSSDGTGSV